VTGVGRRKGRPLILIVGVCGSGKTTLADGLQRLGYNARSLAQEHSVSPRLWQHRAPDFLIFLDCQLETVRLRKDKAVSWERYREQQQVLGNARENADLVVVTDSFTPDELIAYVERALKERGIGPA